MARLVSKLVDILPSSLFQYKGHYALGLMTQDLYQTTPNVVEALRRLPADERNARDQRLKIGFDLSMKKQTLPSNLHVNYETDVPYLQPYLDLVERENAERAAFRQ